MWIITLETALHQEEKGERPILAGIKENLRWHFYKNGYFAATFSNFFPLKWQNFTHFRGMISINKK